VAQLRAGAEVHCTDGEAGTVDALVVDPTEARITHLVVGGHLLAPRALVPVAHVRSSTPEVVELDLDTEALAACPHFDEPDFNPSAPGYGSSTLGYEPGALFLEPYASPVEGWALAEHERIPKGEVTVRRGDEVVAADESHLGHVDELLVDPADGHVTHVVLREGGFFKRRDVVVPVAGARFEEGRIVLGMGVDEVERMDRIPVRRHGHVGSDR
jgi:sporulation protein YlmC with PRC-barrel domain